MQQLVKIYGKLEAVIPAKAFAKSEVQGEDGGMSREEPGESAVTGALSHLHPHDPVSTTVGVSKWKLKREKEHAQSH